METNKCVLNSENIDTELFKNELIKYIKDPTYFINNCYIQTKKWLK